MQEERERDIGYAKLVDFRNEGYAGALGPRIYLHVCEHIIATVCILCSFGIFVIHILEEIRDAYVRYNIYLTWSNNIFCQFPALVKWAKQIPILIKIIKYNFWLGWSYFRSCDKQQKHNNNVFCVAFFYTVVFLTLGLYSAPKRRPMWLHILPTYYRCKKWMWTLGQIASK